MCVVKEECMMVLFVVFDGVNSVIMLIVDDVYFMVVLGGEDVVEKSWMLVDNFVNLEMIKLWFFLELWVEINLFVGLVELVSFVLDLLFLMVFEDKIVVSWIKIGELCIFLGEFELIIDVDDVFD